MTSITVMPPDVGAEMPSPVQLIELANIVRTTHGGWLGSFTDREFACGFFFLTRMWITASPDRSRYFSAWVDDAAVLLAQHGMPSTSGGALMGAVLSTGQIQWRAQDPSIGAVLEIGISPYRGLRWSNRWRLILKGEALLSPVASRDPSLDATGSPLPRPRFFRDGVEISVGESMWAR